MALPNSVFLGSCLAYLMLVLHLSAAPLSVVTPSAVSPPPSPSPLPPASPTESATPSTQQQPKVTDAPTAAVPQVTEEVPPVTEDVFSSDEAIRHLPGYWIKRPSASSASSSVAVGGVPLTPEDEEDSGEAQESFIDYRTERYQIADLFPALSSPPPATALAGDTSQFDAAAAAAAATDSKLGSV